MNNKEIALALAYSESEDEVISILQQEGLWNSNTNWRTFGDNENNWSTIGNQQSEADAALVEKIINAIDSMLMKECSIRGIRFDSNDAPRSIAEALERFFKIKGGKIQDLTPSERSRMAQSIILAATGGKPREGQLNLVIVDEGEGQTPNKMPDTILSLNKSNKLKVPFVQGKFNMGGTGVLRFCGNQNFQLVISKRCPSLADDDETKDLWGFTIVRRERPSGGRRSSVYTYLTDNNGEVLKFQEDLGLPIIPSSTGEHKLMLYGMFCKLFEYKMSSRLCSNINLNLYSRLSMLLPNLAYPILLDECRDYRAHTMFRTLSGLNVRLSDQSATEDSNIEEKLSTQFAIDGQSISATLYVFKKTKSSGKEVDVSQFRADEGILLTQNGQTHGNFDRRFFKRDKVGLSYLAESLLMIVDCTNVDEIIREDLFMNSRDRMSSSDFQKKLEQQLQDFLSENEVLKSIQAKRRAEAIANKISNDKPLEDVLTSVFKSSTVLSKLFLLGERLQNPFNLETAATKEEFIGEFSPTFFTLIRKKEQNKQAQIGRKFRVKFKTDANNDFFSRDEYRGEYSLYYDDKKCVNHAISLYNGTATLNVELPVDSQIGDELQYKIIVTDTCTEKQFEESFTVLIIPYQETEGGVGGREHSGGEKGDGKALKPSGLAMPNVIRVTKEEWDQPDYNFTQTSALTVKKASSENEAYDFFINVDNIHLQLELVQIAKDEARVKLTKARYEYGMVLIGLAIIGHYNKKSSEESIDVSEAVREYSEIVSPILLPMINVLGGYDFDRIIQE